MTENTEALLDELRDVQLIDNTPAEAERAWTEIEAAVSRRGAIEKGHIAALRAVIQEHTTLVKAVQPLLEYLDIVEERYSREGMGGPPDAAYVPGDICRHVCLGTLRRIAKAAGRLPEEIEGKAKTALTPEAASRIWDRVQQLVDVADTIKAEATDDDQSR